MSLTAIDKDSEVSRSVAIVKKGVSTGPQFIDLMRCLMLDVLEDRIDKDKAQLVCNIAGKMLRAIEIQCS